MEAHEQPTVPWGKGDETQPMGPVNATQHLGGYPQLDAQQGKSRRRGLSRRGLLIGASVAGGAVVVGGGIGIAATLSQHNGLSIFSHTSNSTLPANTDFGHLLRRVGFGATPLELQEYSALGYDGAVDRLINYQQVADDDTEKRLKALNLDLSKVQDQQRWWLLRMAWTKRPLLEKMTLFWHGHLTSSYRKVGGAKAYVRIINQNQFLRNHAFDTLDNLLLGITSDPAMLVYLDLNTSRKNKPNENYARELMELFTLGLGNYSQQDVYQAAAALTGWHIVGTQSLEGTYNPKDHNTLTKTFLGKSGNFDYKDVISMLTNHPATPWFIARKLFTFFAYENPSNDDLKPLVDAYLNNNHNMGAVMHALLLSAQFRSAKAYRGRVKSPTEFVIGAYKALNVQGNGQGLPGLTSQMGQTIFDPPNVAGWPGDKVSSLWLNSGAWMTRLNYIDLLVIGTHARASLYKSTDLQQLINDNHIDTPEHFVDYFGSYLFDGNISQGQRLQLLAYFNQPDAHSKEQITLTDGKKYPLGRVRGTLYLMMASPEYQLN